MAAVLFVSYSGIAGGAERILVDVASGLEPPPVVACPEGPLAELARGAGAHVIAIAERRLELRARRRDRALAPARLAAQAREVRSLVRSLEPAVVVAWGARAQLSCAAALRGLRPRPRLVFQHNDVLQAPFVARAVRLAARAADAVVALSSAAVGGLEGLPVRVITPGVDLERFTPAADPPGDGVLVLGAIVPWKRPDLALEAVASAARTLPTLTVTLAGPTIGAASERLLESLRARAQHPDLAGRVRFAGALADPRGALREAACLLHCADCEPFGVALVEALATAVPVVAPRACGPAEIVDPTCGRLFAPGDAQAAGDALVEVLTDSDRRSDLRRAARRRAQRFALSAMRNRYRDVIGAARSSPAAGEALSLVTVLHDSLPQLARFVESVQRHLPAAELIAVDSGSSDSGVEWLRENAPAATIVELGANLGFARGSNAGVEMATRPVTALVNPDLELVDSSLDELVAEALRGPERILAPVVLRPDGRRQDSAQPEPASALAPLHALVPSRALPPPLRERVDPWRATRPRRVGWAVGCCLVAQTETLRRLGPFDTDGFLYAEDLELGLRATDAGVPTWFCPRACVVHHAAHSSARVFRGEPYELLARRRRDVIRRTRGRGRALADDLLQLVTFADRFALKTLLGRPAARERRQLLALLHAARRSGSR